MARPEPEQLVVYLHDMADNPLTWQDQVGHLPEGWRPLTPWLRGMKPTDHDDFDLQAAADALTVYPLEYGIESFVLVGEGLGGTVALRCAADSPGLIAGMVLVNPLIVPDKRALRMQRAALKMTPRGRLAAQNIDKDHLLSALDMLASLDLGDPTTEVDCPTLVLWGEGQPALRQPAEELARTLSHGSVRSVPGTVRPHSEDPEAFNAVVAEFLGSLGHGGAAAGTGPTA